MWMASPRVWFLPRVIPKELAATEEVRDGLNHFRIDVANQVIGHVHVIDALLGFWTQVIYSLLRDVAVEKKDVEP
jgi:hypothetical protein